MYLCGASLKREEREWIHVCGKVKMNSLSFENGWQSVPKASEKKNSKKN